MSLGFVFPGQGAQFVGMLADVAARHGAVQERFAQAGEATGIDIWRIVTEGTDADLAATEITQPALLAASVALWDIWRAQGGPLPRVMAGHSLGEYSALVCAGALDCSDALRLVHRRGQLMQQAVPRGQGAMAAILGLDDGAVETACAAVAGVVSAANYNAPGQLVIAGEVGAVQEAVARCKDAGAKRALPLAVSGPFHCALMAPARAGLAEALSKVAIRSPQIPVVHNVDAQIAADVDGVRQRLLNQLAQPVRWTACVQRMAEVGARRLLECGPGQVLTGLTRRIDRTLEAAGIGALVGLNAALASTPH